MTLSDYFFLAGSSKLWLSKEFKTWSDQSLYSRGILKVVDRTMILVVTVVIKNKMWSTGTQVQYSSINKKQHLKKWNKNDARTNEITFNCNTKHTRVPVHGFISSHTFNRRSSNSKSSPGSGCTGHIGVMSRVINSCRFLPLQRGGWLSIIMIICSDRLVWWASYYWRLSIYQRTKCLP